MDEATTPVANEPHTLRPTRVASPRGVPILQLVCYFPRLGTFASAAPSHLDWVLLK